MSSEVLNELMRRSETLTDEEKMRLATHLVDRDMQRYFQVTPPSVHQMVVTLEANGLIERTPGQGRSIRLLVPREELPDLV